MSISNVKCGSYFSTPSSSIARPKVKEAEHAPYREIASIFPRETTNILRIVESPSLRLHVLANVDVVLTSFGGRKGIVLSTLAEISFPYPLEFDGVACYFEDSLLRS